MGVGAILLGVGAVAWAISVGFKQARETASASGQPSADTPQAKLPPVQRHVPHHALSVLDGCSSDDVRALASGIDGAIDVGAPLYNAGNFAGCYHMYEGRSAPGPRSGSLARRDARHAERAGVGHARRVRRAHRRDCAEREEALSAPQTRSAPDERAHGVHPPSSSAAPIVGVVGLRALP
jgi:hypothetical protein